MPQNGRDSTDSNASSYNSAHSRNSTSSTRSARTYFSAYSIVSGSRNIDQVYGPELPTGAAYGVYDEEAGQYFANDVTQNQIYSRNQSAKSWVPVNNEHVKAFFYGAFPLFLQAAGKSIPGTAGNAVYIAGMVSSGLSGVHAAVTEVRQAMAGEGMDRGRFVGGIVTAVGAACYGYGNYSQLSVPVQNALQTAGAMAQGAGGLAIHERRPVASSGATHGPATPLLTAGQVPARTETPRSWDAGSRVDASARSSVDSRASLHISFEPDSIRRTTDPRSDRRSDSQSDRRSDRQSEHRSGSRSDHQSEHRSQLTRAALMDLPGGRRTPRHTGSSQSHSEAGHGRRSRESQQIGQLPALQRFTDDRSSSHHRGARS